MAEKQEFAVVQVVVPVKVKKDLKKLAERYKLSESKLARNLIITGLDDLHLLNTVGLMDLTCWIRDIVQRDDYQKDVFGNPGQHRLPTGE
jgi:hypothetical protein